MFPNKNHRPNTIKTNWTTEKFRSLFQKKFETWVKFLQNHTVKQTFK